MMTGWENTLTVNPVKYLSKVRGVGRQNLLLGSAYAGGSPELERSELVKRAK